MSLVRVKMSSELHRKFRRWAFDNSTTMQSALVGAAESMCNGKDHKREVVEVDTRGRAPGERALRAVEADAPKPVQVSNPALPTTLKEGYGWCLACKVKQVKLPSILCPSCSKPTP